jgi:hypothetical protein
MKKVVSLVTSLALAALLLAGCGSSSKTNSNTNQNTGAAVKTGLGIVTSIASSTDAGDKDGLAEADSTIAAVTLDKDGKILKCFLDVAQTKVNFSKEGKILTDLKSAFQTKQELKEKYGMKSASKIGKEWYEEANAFSKYVVGKTLDQVKGIAVTTDGHASDKDLASSVTVHVGDFVNAVSKAVANAQDLGAKATDKLGVGVNTDIADCKDAGDKDGVAQVNNYYTVSTFDASGKVTSCIIDSSQAKVNFTKAGKITSDLKADTKSKNELKEQYGMKSSSKIGKEWYEQAAAFAKYATGKTVADVKGVAVTKDGTPSGTDLNTSVTIHIAPFQAIIEKASKNII